MQIFHPNQDSAPYYRLIALVVLIAVFITVAMQSIWKIRVAAERTHVAWMVGAMRSTIGIEVARRAVQGGLDQIAMLDQSNPMLLLDNQKSPMMGAFAYLGELNHPDPTNIAPGSWYFDSQSRELVYRVTMDDAFVSTLKGPARIRFVLKGRYSNSGEKK
ncbi:MAG: hypothetical protein OEL79_03350, partial [Chromatiales bacterium]|nr:hypothetical protein [Chromatiales bacterium]